MRRSITLFISDVSCFSEWPIGYYPDDYMMRCRVCEVTCYTCSGRFTNNSISCVGEIKFVESHGLCVEMCELYFLIQYSVDPNRCIEFDANAVC